MIKAYYLNTSPLQDTKLFEKALPLTSSYRKSKVLSIKDPLQKCCSLGAGLLLKHALHLSGLNINDYVIKTNENGKPYFENSPVFFSISHSGHFAICIISDGDIGLDIENVRRAKIKIAERFFSEDERDYLKSIPQSEQNVKFTEFWTQKEAYAKFKGASVLDVLKGGKLETDFANCKGESSCFQAAECFFHTLLIESNYILSVCTKKKEDLALSKVLVNDII